MVYFCFTLFFFFEGYGDHRDLHVLTHSFPTRRSSDLRRRLTDPVLAMPRRRAVLRLMLSAEEHLFEPGKLVPELHRLLRPEASEVLQLPLHRRKPGRIDRQVELRPVGLAREERPQEGSSSTFARTRSEEHTSELQSLMRTSYA